MRFPFLLVASVANALTHRSTPVLFGYTGFEEQISGAIQKTSLYSINPRDGLTALVVNYDDGVKEKQTGDLCLAGQDAHFAYSKTQGTIYGMPQTGANAPMIVYNFANNQSSCDPGVENDWGLLILENVNGTSAAAPPPASHFIAFNSNYGSMSGWSFSISLLTTFASPSQPAVSEQQLSWDESTKGGDAYFICASTIGFAMIDGASRELFVMCGGGIGEIPWVIITVDVHAAGKWKVVRRTNVTADISDSLFTTLGFSEKEGGIRVVLEQKGNGVQKYLVGYMDPVTGDWTRKPTQVAGNDRLQAVAIDSETETAYAYAPLESSPAAILTIDFALGTVSRRVEASDTIAITDMVFADLH